MTVLELRSVHKRYGSVEALAGLDLRVARGEVVALLGPNGAGKTTAFELLLGLARPTSGEARVLGEAPGGRVKRRLGVMLQDAGLPEQVTVSELVRLIGRSYPVALPVDEVLARVGLTDRRRRTVTDLSGGERQRLLLALAIVSAPELLLLDEPTAAMDVASRRAFWERTRASVRDGATMLFATHDLAEADAVADRVVVLGDGRLIADAPPAALKRLVASKTIRVTTDAPVAVVTALPGAERIELDDVGGGPAPPGMQRLLVHAAKAEDVLVPLVLGGHAISDLTVADADLEDAFVHLTRAAPPVPTLDGAPS
ncbi:MAG: ABC transporter ATP-binding protein [Egibacteraceae bacterium]